MTQLQKQKLRAEMTAQGFSERSIEYSIQVAEENEAFLKYRKKAIRKNKLLKFIDDKCDLICEDIGAIVYEFYGKRKNYQFTHYKTNTDNVFMRWCWVSDEDQDFSWIDEKAIHKMSELSMLKR